MSYFLPKGRQDKLVTDLMRLTCPAELAHQFANYRDDVAYVDSCLSFTLNNLAQRCRLLVEAAIQRDGDRVHSLRTFIEADVAVLDVYLDEIKDRKLPQRLFPRLMRAMQAVIASTDRCRALISAESPDGKVLQ